MNPVPALRSNVLHAVEDACAAHGEVVVRYGVPECTSAIMSAPTLDALLRLAQKVAADHSDPAYAAQTQRYLPELAALHEILVPAAACPEFYRQLDKDTLVTRVCELWFSPGSEAQAETLSAAFAALAEKLNHDPSTPKDSQ